MEVEMQENENVTPFQSVLIVSLDSNIPEETLEVGSETETEPGSPAPSQSSQSETSEAAVSCKGKKRTLSSEDEDDGTLCPICLDNWTNTGDHRICALKCGHLFGYKCVQRWLDGQPRKTCPTCKKKVGRKDIRLIFAKKLIAVDNSEVEELRKENEFLIQEKNKLQIELTKAMCREHVKTKEIEELKKQVSLLSETLETRKHVAQLQPTHSSKTIEKNLMYMDKSIEICKNNGCRVIEIRNDVIMATVKTMGTLFAPYGVKTVNISNYKPTTLIPLHTEPIRDIKFHPHHDVLLTVSVDKTFKITNITNNVISNTTQCNVPLWSCCWDSNNPNTFYVGSMQGTVLKYDLRNSSTTVETITFPTDLSPVVSLESIPNAGLLACKLNNVWIHDAISNTPTPLSLSGPFVCARHQKSTGQLLISARPNARCSPYARHILCTLSRNDSGYNTCNTVHTFQGGHTLKLLSRPCFLSGSQDFVAAQVESAKKVFLWSVNTGDLVGALPAHEPVLDLCGAVNGEENILVSATERKLEFFKFS